jgi:hypothetical protein
MSAYKDQNFEERLNVAASARKAMLERFRAMQTANDPAVLERRTARQAINDAREARLAERKAALKLENLRQAVVQEAQDIAAACETAEREARRTALHAEEQARAVLLKAEQKAARDARYAGRKARR